MVTSWWQALQVTDPVPVLPLPYWQTTDQSQQVATGPEEKHFPELPGGWMAKWVSSGQQEAKADGEAFWESSFRGWGRLMSRLPQAPRPVFFPGTQRRWLELQEPTCDREAPLDRRAQSPLGHQGLPHQHWPPSTNVFKDNKTPNWFKILVFILLSLATKQSTICEGFPLQSTYFHLRNVYSVITFPGSWLKLIISKGISSWVLGTMVINPLLPPASIPSMLPSSNCSFRRPI